MNRTLFITPHAIAPLAIAGGALIYAQVSGIALGRGAGSSHGFQVSTGWLLIVLLAVVMAYVLRKYSHRGRYSPEFKMRREFAALERADIRIRALRPQILSGSLGSKAAIQREANAILKQEDVHKVNRAVVEPGLPGGDAWRIRIAPREPLGRVRKWMHVHLYYGIAFGLLLWIHSGGAAGSGLGVLLAAFGYLVAVTGIGGIYLWATGPTRLTRRERDISIEEAHALAETRALKRAAALDELDPAARGMFEDVIASGCKVESAERALARLIQSSPGRRDEYTDLMALLFQERATHDELRALRRVRSSFMDWKLVHVPAALVLCGLVVLHVLTIWVY